MSKVKEGNYIVIQSFMVTDLHLKGTDLIVYAIIYGFSQAENQAYTGSLQYLADWTNCTKQGVMKNLKSLMQKGLIEKKETVLNDVKFCEYRVTKFNGKVNKVGDGVKQSLTVGSKQSLTNNIGDDNIVNKKDNNMSDFEMLWSLYPRKEGKKQAMTAYKRAVKAGVSVETIRKGIEAYISYIQREKVKPQYIKMGSTWFNGECWNDDYGQHIVGMYNDHDLDDVF